MPHGSPVTGCLRSLGHTPTPTPTPITPTPSFRRPVVMDIDTTSTDGWGDAWNGYRHNCDDCTSPVTLPFPVNIYGTIFNSAVAESNGTLQFTGDTTVFTSGCNPLPNVGYAGRSSRTTTTAYRALGTHKWHNGRCGIYASTTGSVGSRVVHPEVAHEFFGRAGGETPI